MGKAIVIGVVVIAIALIGFTAYMLWQRFVERKFRIETNHPLKGELNYNQERVLLNLLGWAEEIMKSFEANPTSLDEDMNILTPQTSRRTKAWLAHHEKMRKQLDA